MKCRVGFYNFLWQTAVFVAALLVSVLCLGFFVTAKAESAADGLSIVFPLMAPQLSSQFGERKHPIYKSHKHHDGVDLAAPSNSHVRSVFGGKVVYAGDYKGYGKLVTISHGEGFTSLYGHLNEMLVNPGDTVKAGEIIGRVGSTGASTGPHLHFEWRHFGKAINPLKVFPSLAAKAEG